MEESQINSFKTGSLEGSRQPVSSKTRGCYPQFTFSTQPHPKHKKAKKKTWTDSTGRTAISLPLEVEDL